MQSKEFLFKAFQGTEIFYQLWEVPNPRGTLLITHGQAEHSDAYLRLVHGLKDLNWNIYGWDLRGHGRSEGKRGYASTFDDYSYDFELLLKRITQSHPQRPLVLLGHSMGGLVTLKTIIDNTDITYDALVLSAPLLGLKLPVPAIKSKGASVINLLAPTFTLGNEINFEDLTRDPQIVEEYRKDALRHDRISPGVFLGFSEAMPVICAKASKLKAPLLMQIPLGDRICNPDVSIQFFENIGSTDKSLITYEGAMHEIYNDLVREKAYADLKSFLQKHEVK